MSIIYEKKDKVAYIILNRPEVNNAINGETNEDLYKIWNDFRDDPNCWVAIFSGMGEKSFSAGADLTDMENLRKSIDGGHSFGGMTKDFETWKPIIAAVNGSAFGGGLEMILACDIRIASNKAKFGLTEVRWGMIPGGGGTQRLIRNVVKCLAFEMLLSGKVIDAEEAYRVHLVNKIVASQDVMLYATNLAKDICEAGPLAVRAGKEAMTRGLSMPLEEGLQLESVFVKTLRETEDAKEGIEAFREKRKPIFKGR